MFPILHSSFTQLAIAPNPCHDAYMPPVPPAPITPMAGLVEGPVPMHYPVATFLHKQATTVMADGAPLIQAGHDVGYGIPHIPSVPNALSLVHTAFSKHKVPFPIGKVVVEGKPAGTYLLFLGGIVCGSPVSVPAGLVVLLQCTVWSQITMADFFRGLANIALEIVFDLLWRRLSSRFKFQDFGQVLTGYTTREVLATPGAMRVVASLLFRRMMTGNVTPAPALRALGGLSLREMVTDPGALRAASRFVGEQLLAKGAQHLVKSWVVGPIVVGGANGAPGLGRGSQSVKFFDEEWW